MTAFDGFSTENLVPLPAEFFTTVLPSISSPAELKVTLHIFWAVSRQRGRAKRVDWETLLGDETLTQGLRAISALRPAAELLEEGLARAVERGSILHVVSAEAGRAVNWYLVNTAANRAWAERQNGARLEPTASLPPPAPGIFALYEQNIGLLTPMLVEELREADRKYPALWLEDAVRAAVEANIRNWRYIRRILERWEADGKESAPHRSEQSFDLSKYTSGKYAAFFGRTDTND
jgi:DNA replication protein